MVIAVLYVSQQYLNCFGTVLDTVMQTTLVFQCCNVPLRTGGDISRVTFNDCRPVAPVAQRYLVTL